jgi:hypothetical protein
MNITIPEVVELVDIEGKPLKDNPKESLYTYLHKFIFNEFTITPPKYQGDKPTMTMKIGIGRVGNQRVARLTAALKLAAPGEVVKVDEEDWKLVKTIIEQKSWPSVTLSSQFTPLEDAWFNAE